MSHAIDDELPAFNDMLQEGLGASLPTLSEAEVEAGLADLHDRMAAINGDPRVRRVFDAEVDRISREVESEELGRQAIGVVAYDETAPDGLSMESGSAAIADIATLKARLGVGLRELQTMEAREDDAFASRFWEKYSEETKSASVADSPESIEVSGSRKAAGLRSEIGLSNFPTPPQRKSRWETRSLLALLSGLLVGIVSGCAVIAITADIPVPTALAAGVASTVFGLGILYSHLSGMRKERTAVLNMARAAQEEGNYDAALAQLKLIFPPDPGVEHAAVYGRTLSVLTALEKGDDRPVRITDTETLINVDRDPSSADLASSREPIGNND